MLLKFVDSFGAKQSVKRPKYSLTSMDNVHFVKSKMNESGDLLR